jgi:dUTP pyrophosphatase
MPLYLQRLSEFATRPTRATEGSAGLDLLAADDVIIPEYSRAWIGTGLAVAIAPAHVGLVWTRSGLAGQGLDTSAGVIDSDYRGEVKVLLCNSTTYPKTVHRGERIAQLLILPVATPTLIEVDALPASGRGPNGFGSTGV